MSTVIEDLKRVEDRLLARIQELEANVAELEELRELAARLGIRAGQSRNGSPESKEATTGPLSRRARLGPRAYAGAGRTRTSTRAATRGRPRSAPGPQSTRRERVLELVAVNPGISVRELVEELSVNRTSLYPVVRQLISDGLLRKDGKGLWPASP